MSIRFSIGNYYEQKELTNDWALFNFLFSLLKILKYFFKLVYVIWSSLSETSIVYLCMQFILLLKNYFVWLLNIMMTLSLVNIYPITIADRQTQICSSLHFKCQDFIFFKKTKPLLSLIISPPPQKLHKGCLSFEIIFIVLCCIAFPDDNMRVFVNATIYYTEFAIGTHPKVPKRDPSMVSSMFLSSRWRNYLQEPNWEEDTGEESFPTNSRIQIGFAHATEDAGNKGKDSLLPL